MKNTAWKRLAGKAVAVPLEPREESEAMAELSRAVEAVERARRSPVYQRAKHRIQSEAGRHRE